VGKNRRYESPGKYQESNETKKWNTQSKYKTEYNNEVHYYHEFIIELWLLLYFNIIRMFGTI
jgi:hypothetical protein